KMIAASTHRLSISLVKPAPRRTYTSTLLNWAKNRINGPRFLPSGKRFGPYVFKRFEASTASRPFPATVASCRKTSSRDTACQAADLLAVFGGVAALMLVLLFLS